MSAENETLLNKRLTRRQLLSMAAVGGSGLAAAALLGCGDDEEGGATPTGTRPSGVSYPDPGISDTEIKLGSVLPLTGPILGTNALPNGLRAFMNFVNEEKGGVNGRRINLTILDGAYVPPQSLDQTRRLVEEQRVFAMVAVLGTPINAAVLPFMEQRGVPNIGMLTGASIFLNASEHPGTLMGNMPYLAEGGNLGRYIASEFPNAKIGVLRQNDSLGQSYLDGLQKALGGRSSQIVSVQTYEVTDTALESQALNMRNAGAELVCLFSILRPSIAFIRSASGVGYQPHYFSGLTAGPTDIVRSIGPEQFKDRFTALFIQKDPRDPQYQNDPSVLEGRRIVERYAPGTQLEDPNWIFSLSLGEFLVEALRTMKEPTRKGLVEAGRAIKGFTGMGFLLPGVTWDSQPRTNATLSKQRLARWDGTRWVQFGGVVDGAQFLT
ncbi:MAG TPA: ABC transporter substrate-binding protein [Dehalococcoidia bacterium]|nr:ABC transporter substrate-binding protein [Dehalococcoidia bacterium]